MKKCINRQTISNGDHTLQPIILQPSAEKLEPGPRGINIRSLIRSSQTNHQFACQEFAMAPKKMGPAPHIHSHLDEISLILEGSLHIMVGDKIEELHAGGFSLRPHGVIHSFWNASDKPARFLEFYCNQNFDDFLEELFFGIIADMVENNIPPQDPRIANRAKALHKEYDVVLFPEQSKAIIEKYGLMA